MYSNTAESFKFLIKTSWGNWLRKLFFQTFPEYWRLMGGWTKKTTQNLEHTSFNAHQCLIILSFVILDYTFVLHLVVSLDFAVIHRFCSSCSRLYSSYNSDFSILLVVSSLFFSLSHFLSKTECTLVLPDIPTYSFYSVSARPHYTGQ